MSRRMIEGGGRGAKALVVILVSALLGAFVYGLGIWLVASGDGRIVLLIGALAAGGVVVIVGLVGSRGRSGMESAAESGAEDRRRARGGRLERRQPARVEPRARGNRGALP